MRELKFRAWNKRMKVLGEVDNIRLGRGGGCSILIDGKPVIAGTIEDKNVANYGQEHYFMPMREVVLMEFAGQDIDGKEVYEGDLLVFPGDKNTYEVKYSEDIAGLGIYYRGMDVFKMGMTKMMQVVGNIYENKETKNAKTG